MASNFRRHSVIFVIIGIFFLATVVNSIPAEEFNSMLDTLRIRGYELFCNAIVTSDLQFELLSSQNDNGIQRSFTFLAPIDSSLFALDMTQTATYYIDTLRFHIVPHRFSISDLLGLPNGSTLPTLLSRRYLNVTQGPGLVAVGGVNVAYPGLFYGRHVVVHGLSGIIRLRSSAATGGISGSPVDSSDRRSFPPGTGSNPSENHSVMAPSPSAHPRAINILSVIPKADIPARETADTNGHFHSVSPFNPAVHLPEPDEPNPLDNINTFAPEDSRSYSALPFTQAVPPSEPDEPSSLDNLMVHALEDSHFDATWRFNRAVHPPEPDESHSLDNLMSCAPKDSDTKAASQFKQAVPPAEPDEPNSLDNLKVYAQEHGHVGSASRFSRAVLPPELDESNSLDYPMIRAQEANHSLELPPAIHGICPASSTESPANICVPPPVVSHASTPTSGSLEYRHSSISAPPLEYSDPAAPTAMSPDGWQPNKRGVILIETFKGDSERLNKTVHYPDKGPEMPQPLVDDKKMSEKYELLDRDTHCVDPDVGLGLQNSNHQSSKCRHVCE